MRGEQQGNYSSASKKNIGQMEWVALNVRCVDFA
jgi:hypothetical protein